jgi:hypothetical protein
VRLANEATNELYANRLFGDMTGRTFESALRIQRAGDALASAFFGNLWPSVGLPTASQIQGLRDEVMALRQDMRANSDKRHIRAHDQSDPDGRVALQEEGLRMVRNGANAETMRTAREDKQRAAA